MSKYKKYDAFYVRDLSFEDFIELHQKLEKNGEKMYYSTKERKIERQFNYQVLVFDGTSWSGAGYKSNKTPFDELSKEYSFQDINLSFNSEPNYEIY